MFEFFRRKNGNPPIDDSTSQVTETNDISEVSEKSLMGRLKEKLSRTRAVFNEGLARIFLGKKEIDAAILEELEHLLLSADLGVEATQDIIQTLQNSVKRHQLNDAASLEQALKQNLIELLLPYEQSFPPEKSADLQRNDANLQQAKPYIILMVGVNGSGKTTTIGKLAKRLQNQGKSVMLAAGDTFRAAAIEQLQVWGDRNAIPVIAQHTGADSASVIFDAMQAAKSRNIDVLIADTAGRLHTQHPLMEELKKVVRVLQKQDPTAPHETMLILDAGIGQNALVQAKRFHEIVTLSSLTLTKLDGTAKGGMIFNIAKNLKLPIRFIGVGESIEDLRPFRAAEFVEALFN